MGYYVECPHCGSEYDLDLTVAEGLEEDVTHSATCEDCKKKFWFETDWQPQFKTHQHQTLDDHSQGEAQ